MADVVLRGVLREPEPDVDVRELVLRELLARRLELPLVSFRVVRRLRRRVVRGAGV